jgi:hypothetical protein
VGEILVYLRTGTELEGQSFVRKPGKSLNPKFFSSSSLLLPHVESVLSLRSIGLILLSFLIRTVGRTPWTGD